MLSYVIGSNRISCKFCLEKDPGFSDWWFVVEHGRSTQVASVEEYFTSFQRGARSAPVLFETVSRKIHAESSHTFLSTGRRASRIGLWCP